MTKNTTTKKKTALRPVVAKNDAQGVPDPPDDPGSQDNQPAHESEPAKSTEDLEPQDQSREVIEVKKSKSSRTGRRNEAEQRQRPREGPLAMPFHGNEGSERNKLLEKNPAAGSSKTDDQEKKSDRGGKPLGPADRILRQTREFLKEASRDPLGLLEEYRESIGPPSDPKSSTRDVKHRIGLGSGASESQIAVATVNSSEGPDLITRLLPKS
jgi:hypothetical protein